MPSIATLAVCLSLFGGPAFAEGPAVPSDPLNGKLGPLTTTILPDSEEFFADVLRAVKNELSVLAATTEHAKFMEERGVEFRVEKSNPDNAFDRINALATYNDSRVTLPAFILSEPAAQLLRQGFPPQEVAVFIALKMTPTVAHELRHGINEARVEKETGIKMKEPLVEDEVLAFVDKIRTRAELREKYPELERFRLHAVDDGADKLEEAWAQGAEALIDFVQKRYGAHGVRSVLEASPDELRADWAKAQAQAVKALGKLREGQRALASASSDELREQVRTFLGKMPSDRASLSKFRDARQAGQGLSDPRRAAKLRAFYQAEYEKLAKEWQSDYWRRWRGTRRRAP